MKNERLYTLTHLVSFGNYLLSENRKQTITNKENIREVHDCDVANWAQECEVAEK